MTQKEAALVSLSERQLRRIVKRIREEGDRGIVHRSRGNPPQIRLPKKLKQRIIHLYKKTYEDFGPTLVTPHIMFCSSFSLA
jgi:hypothetical protein